MTIYFDMDGTLADLYGQPDWLTCLRAEDAAPFVTAKPLLDTWQLSKVLAKLRSKGYRIGVISWTPKDASNRYADRVRTAKLYWLRQNIFVPLDEIQIVPYGENKKNCAEYPGILFDDEKPNREAWGCENAHTPDEIMSTLLDLLG